MDPLKDVRIDVAPFVGPSGACPDDESVLEAINQARRILYPLGEWKDTVTPVVLNSQYGIVTLPSDYEYLKHTHYSRQVCGIDNGWYSVLNGFSSYCGAGVANRKQDGEYVTFRDWPRKTMRKTCSTAGFFIKLVAEDYNDIGVKLVFQAIGEFIGRISLTRTISAAHHPHLALPGELPIAELRYVTKPVTKGRIRVYGYDGANEFLLAVYEPHEINPQYTRYIIGVNHARPYQIVGKCKKKYKPILSEDEPVDIHTEALIHTLQALTDRKSRDNNSFNSNLRLATDFLNKEIAGPQSVRTVPMKMSHAYKVTGLIE